MSRRFREKWDTALEKKADSDDFTIHLTMNWKKGSSAVHFLPLLLFLNGNSLFVTMFSLCNVHANLRPVFLAEGTIDSQNFEPIMSQVSHFSFPTSFTQYWKSGSPFRPFSLLPFPSSCHTVAAHPGSIGKRRHPFLIQEYALIHFCEWKRLRRMIRLIVLRF